MAENVVDMTIVLVMAPSSRRRLSSVHCPFSIDLRKEKEGSMEVTDVGRRLDIERERAERLFIRIICVRPLRRITQHSTKGE